MAFNDFFDTLKSAFEGRHRKILDNAEIANESARKIVDMQNEQLERLYKRQTLIEEQLNENQKIIKDTANELAEAREQLSEAIAKIDDISLIAKQLTHEAHVLWNKRCLNFDCPNRCPKLDESKESNPFTLEEQHN